MGLLLQVTWNGNRNVWELTRRSELLRCKNLSMKSRMPNHSSGKFCKCDREGRCCRNTWGWGSCQFTWTAALVYPYELGYVCGEPNSYMHLVPWQLDQRQAVYFGWVTKGKPYYRCFVSHLCQASVGVAIETVAHPLGHAILLIS